MSKAEVTGLIGTESIAALVSIQKGRSGVNLIGGMKLVSAQQRGQSNWSRSGRQLSI